MLSYSLGKLAGQVNINRLGQHPLKKLPQDIQRNIVVNL